uniref:Uncharacterized protein n=1 Tax=Caenorhabditis japonica TaxID=281687 RepID=A0A8R1DFT9_CAEJA
MLKIVTITNEHGDAITSRPLLPPSSPFSYFFLHVLKMPLASSPIVMGGYSGPYVCIPLKVNFWWLPIVFLQFIIVILAFCSHCVFMRLVVVRQRFGLYTRITFTLISAMMQIMLLTSSGAFVLTLAYGKLIEDCEVSQLELRKYLLYIHSFGEYFFVISEVLATIERVTTTFSHKFRKSNIFPPIFTAVCALGTVTTLAYIYFIRIAFDKTLLAIGFGSLTLMELINGVTVFSLWYIAMKKYKTKKDATLSVRFEVRTDSQEGLAAALSKVRSVYKILAMCPIAVAFSQSYAYSRCAAASVVARVLLYTYIYMKLAGFFDGALDEAFYYVMNMFINSYCLVYPWTIMLSHRKINSQIRGLLGRHIKLFRCKQINQDGIKTLYTIDGRQMNAGTTDDHFQQLNTFWNLSASPKFPRES